MLVSLQIFIIEGLMTVVGGLLCFLILADSPALASRWLTPDEIRYLELRQLSRQINSPQEFREKRFDWKYVLSVVLDWKMYLFILVSWSNAVPNYALKFTMPTIVKSMGFTSANAQLLTIPPYVCGAISAYILSLLADRASWRMPYIVGPQACVITAFAILFAKADDISHNIALCYFAVCLSCAG